MNETLNKILHHPARTPIFVGIACFGMGFVVGRRNRIVARTTPDTKPIGFIDLMKETDKGLEIQGHLSDDGESIFEKLREEDVEIRVAGVSIGSETENPVAIVDPNPGEDVPEDVWVWDREHAKRDEDGIYILHKDEFYQDERGYTQTTLTYYRGDDILVDQESVPIYNYADIVGPFRFGFGSDSDTVFFVRNNKHRAEYEIILEEGKYSVEVMGLDAEVETEDDQLKHSRRRSEE